MNMTKIFTYLNQVIDIEDSIKNNDDNDVIIAKLDIIEDILDLAIAEITNVSTICSKTKKALSESEKK